jgi:hypothetical protein
LLCDISHETVRFWWNRFGRLFAAEIRKKRIQQLSAYSNWQWHLDEIFVKINGETHYLWRAVDHEGEVLESYVIKRRDEGHWQRRQTGNGALAQQLGREFTPIAWQWFVCKPREGAFSTKRAGDAALQTNANIAEIRLRSRLSPQPFQPGTPPLQPRKLQA